MKILAIDDDEIVLGFMEIAVMEEIEDAELTPYPAAKLGKPAPDFDFAQYDVLLLDYHLGNGQTGVMWLQEFYNTENFPATVLITAASDPYVVADALKSGADSYLNKADMTPERLAEVILDVMGDPLPEETMPMVQDEETDTLIEAIEDAPDLVMRFVQERAAEPDKPQYEFRRTLGKGGMSSVYLAKRLGDNRLVAIKLLDGMTVNLDEWQRFILEGETVASLSSPHIIELFEQGATRSVSFIVMEYFANGDLKQRAPEPQDAPTALRFLREILTGLMAIHSAGIVHRDMKPHNVMVADDDRLVVADFGVAKLVDSDLELTRTGLIIGSPYYMSPEQAASGYVDVRSDLYSAGVIFYELLTGKRPCVGQLTAVVFQHVHAEVPTLPEGLEHCQPLLNRLMAKKLDERYATASAALDDLEKLV